jgi:Cys-rich four helix bundle protein (predicted Tat secretion target)
MANRRDFMRSGVALAGAAALLAVRAGTARATHHEGHGAAAPTGGGHATLTPALAGCIQRGQECMAHCIELMGKGVTDLAACAASVRTMLAVCEATAVLVTTTSPRTRAIVDLCRDVCTDCEAECRKHADKHPVCKACGDACAATVASIRALPA